MSSAVSSSISPGDFFGRLMSGDGALEVLCPVPVVGRNGSERRTRW
jgi:hypothetical protein